MSDETPKQFLKRHGGLHGKMADFSPLYAYLVRHSAEASVSAYVKRDSGHYVHERSTTVYLDTDGFGNDAGGQRAQVLAIELRDQMEEQVVDWNRDIYRELEIEYEHLTSDEQVAENLDANDMFFDEDGDRVDMTDFELVTGLPGPIQQKVVQTYVDLFDRTPEQVLKALVDRKIKFDAHGNRIDTSQYVSVCKLAPKVKEKVLDRYREWNIEGIDWWDVVYDIWKEDLAKYGFEGIDINFSGFSSQGDGASFTATSVDVLKYLKAMDHPAKRESVDAVKVARGLLEGV